MKCPHCLVAFHDKWNDAALANAWYVHHTICPECHRSIILLSADSSRGRPHGKMMVYPKGFARAPVPIEVTADFADDYKEACLILGDSPKASAALSRRCLQHILREKAGTKARELADQIQEVLDSRQLPTQLADALDAVRQIGNFAAHPMKSNHSGEILDVEPGEAEWSLDVIESLFDFYFVQPAILQKKKDALNKKLSDAGKPPMK